MSSNTNEPAVYAQVVQSKQKCTSCDGHGFLTTRTTIRAKSRPMTLDDAKRVASLAESKDKLAASTNEQHLFLSFSDQTVKLPVSVIEFVDVSGECFETCPCQHNTRHIFKIGNEFVYYQECLDGDDILKLFQVLDAKKTHPWVLKHLSGAGIEACDVTEDYPVNHVDMMYEDE